MNSKITVDQAIQGFFLALQSRHLSKNTELDYANSIGKFRRFLDSDPPIAEITTQHIQRFLKSQVGLTNKTLLNYYIGLSALWTWAVSEQIVERHVVKATPAPDPEEREIVPYTQDEVKSMINALKRSRVYQRPGQRPADHAIPFPERNRALILVLVDTGVRVEELCQARLYNLDRRNSRLHVMGKGAKERHVPFSARTGQALWRYLTTRKDLTEGDPVFVTNLNRPFHRHRVLHLLQTIGARAGVTNITVHRFRHTFAIQYLRNGGDPYTLQKLLGHSTMEMVKRYLALAQIDLDNAHRRASPADNWGL